MFRVLGSPFFYNDSSSEGRWRGEQLTCKEHPPCEHLGQDAAGSPHVDGFGVVVRGEEQAW